MVLFALKFDLFQHMMIAGFIGGFCLVRYGDLSPAKDETTGLVAFDWNNTLTGAVAVAALLNAVMSFVNFAKDVLIDDGKCEVIDQDGTKKRVPKTKLQIEMWNVGRNLFTSLSMVLLCFLYGYADDNEKILVPLILVAVLRISDVTLDCTNIIQIQCISTSEDKARSYRTMFGGLSMLVALILFIIYAVEHPFDWDSEDTGDEIALTVAISGLSLHLLLILLHLVFNQIDDCKKNARVWFGSDKDPNKPMQNCDGYGVHMPNEIPLVSKVVFTLTIGALAIVVGERIEENLDVTLLIWILMLIGATELAGRNIL